MKPLPKCNLQRTHITFLMVLIYSVEHCTSDLQLTILHTNDIHSHLEESNKYGGTCFEKDRNASKCVGGVARIVTKVKEFKNNDSNVLFMNAGDFFQGTPYYTLLKQRVISEVMSKMGYDYVCLGNHEFDDGPENLALFLQKMNESNITVIGTNTNFTRDEYLKPYDLVKSAQVSINGTAVGFLGAVIPDTQFTSSPGPYVQFYDEISSFKEEAAKLRNAGVGIIVAITHSGFKREIAIVENVTEIDVLVGGHTNTFLYTGTDYPEENKPEGPYPYMVNRTDGSRGLIVQDFWFGKFLGHLEVTFNSSGHAVNWRGNPILLNASVPEDDNMTELLKPFKENITTQMRRVIGRTMVLMEHEHGICRLRECNLGNLVADAYYDYYVKRSPTNSSMWSNINGAVVNAGSIRTALPSFSNVTWGDVVTTLPYGNSLVVMTLDGVQVWQLFEHSVANYSINKERRQGRFLQVSGFRVKYNLTKPNGQRVVSIGVLCTKCKVPVYERVKCEETYNIVALDYLTRGGDGFSLLKTANVSESGPIDYEALEEYVIKMSPLRPADEGRIRITWNDTDREVVRNETQSVRM